MRCITIRFYGELNDFLAPDNCQQPFLHHFDGRPSIKDLIESLGVPHPEVDLILINGESACFSERVSGGEQVSVYPVFKAIDITATTLVRPDPLSEIRFVLDCHLGKLAAYLRMLGFDSVFSNKAADDKLAHISADEHRILLTRDRGLLKRTKVVYGYYVRDLDPALQLTEVLTRFELWGSFRPFERCMRCNEALIPVPKDAVRSYLPEKVREYCHDFRFCPGCERIYWQGTHYEQMQKFIRSIGASHPARSLRQK